MDGKSMASAYSVDGLLHTASSGSDKKGGRVPF